MAVQWRAKSDCQRERLRPVLAGSTSSTSGTRRVGHLPAEARGRAELLPDREALTHGCIEWLEAAAAPFGRFRLGSPKTRSFRPTRARAILWTSLPGCAEDIESSATPPGIQRLFAMLDFPDSGLRPSPLRGRHRLRRYGTILPALRCGRMVRDHEPLDLVRTHRRVPAARRTLSPPLRHPDPAAICPVGSP